MKVPEGWRLTDIGSNLVGSTLRNAEGEFSHGDLRAVNKTLGMVPMKDRVKGKSVDRAKIVKKGWFAYNPMRINVGSICRWEEEEDCIVSPDYVAFHCNENSLLNDYFYHFRHSYRWKRFMGDAGHGSVRIRIYLEDLKKLSCALPPITEQKRIAEILSTWDRAIETVEKLIANSQAQKKALMQQLLTGKKRLPGFQDNWSEFVLGSIGDTYSGLSGKSKKDFGSGQIYVPYKNVFKNSEVDFSSIDYVQIADDENQNEVRHGDIIFTTSSETPEEVGMSSVVISPPARTHLNSFCFGFRPKNLEQLNPIFSKHFFRCPAIRQEISSLAQGSTRHNLSKREMLKLRIRLPSIKEQNEIAFILESGERAEINFRKIHKCITKEKSALMQQLLTGKRRVKVEEADNA